LNARFSIIPIALSALLVSNAAFADEVSPKGKGIAGGALLGAEVAVMTEAIIGLDNPWWYAAGVAGGAGGGAVGGYYIEKGGSAGLPVAMLVAGMALFIPTCIVYLDATDESGMPVESEPVPPADQARLGPALVQATLAHSTLLPSTLLPSTQAAVTLRVPSIEISETRVSEELRSLGVTEHTEVNVALFGGTF
jgi:hypothetical protein